MRRKDREITNMNDIMDIIRRCTVCNLAFFDNQFPYVIPMNFGANLDKDKLYIFFHGSSEGKKIELLKNNNKVAFEMNCPGKFLYNRKACEATMEFESVCGNGTIEIAGEDEKKIALTAIMRQYSTDESYDFEEKAVKIVTVLKLTVNELTGKKHKSHI